MSAFQPVQLKEVVRTVKSWNPLRAGADETFNYIDLSAIDQDSKRIIGAREITCGEAPSRARQLVEKDDVLVATVRPNLNGVAIVPPELHEATASTGFCVIRPDQEKLDPSYLFHWVKTEKFVSAMVKQATGASYPAVSDKIVLGSSIPLPSLPEQRRIAAILNKAEALRTKRREALVQLDSLAKSIFVEMFGDPVSNPRGWPSLPIASLGNVITGNTPPRANTANYGNSIEWIKSDNLNNPNYFATPADEKLSEVGKLRARTAPPLSILVTCIAGSPDCIGNSAMIDREVAFNQQINAFVPASGNPHFFYALFKVGKRLIQEASTNGMKGLVSKGRFEKIKVIVPPRELQNKFAEIAWATEQQIAAQRNSLGELDALFASLQHQSFHGALSV